MEPRDLPPDVDAPAPTDPAEAEDPALYDHSKPPIVASYGARLHLRRADLGEGVVNDYPEPTLAELEAYLEGALAVAAPAFTATIEAERLDE